jgi:hypothetical protein
VKSDATTKSTLYFLDAEDQLASMKLSDDDDLAAHLTELKSHFQLMTSRCDNLLKMGSELSNSCYHTIIMQSLPESYRLALQTITATEQASSALATEATAS